MLSPIARKSILEARERRAAGEEIKGTGRRVTTYKAPSIAERIAAAPSIEALAALREFLAELFRAGTLAPDERTRQKWNEALWVRVLELIRAPDSPDCPTFILNTVRRWPKPEGLAAALEAAAAAKCAAMPAPISRFVVVGVNA